MNIRTVGDLIDALTRLEEEYVCGDAPVVINDQSGDDISPPYIVTLGEDDGQPIVVIE